MTPATFAKLTEQPTPATAADIIRELRRMRFGVSVTSQEDGITANVFPSRAWMKAWYADNHDWLDQHEPSPEDARRFEDYLESAGFTCGESGGGNFSMVNPALNLELYWWSNRHHI